MGLSIGRLSDINILLHNCGLLFDLGHPGAPEDPLPVSGGAAITPCTR